MGIFSLIVASIISSSLKKDYQLPHMQKSGGFVVTLIVLWLLSMMFNPIFTIVIWIILKNNGVLDDIKKKTGNKNNSFYNSTPTDNKSYTSDYKYTKSQKVSNPYDLPKRVAGRKKIISKFNEKYNLTLSSQDIKNMADATYMSIEWASEVYSMQKRYNSVYEWLGQGNSWLRLYLYVFNVQNISAIFNKQEELVFRSFDTIFSEMCTDDNLPTEVVIQNINNKYLTNFDDTTFMMAISYMESKGKRYKYGAPILTRVTSDIENLTRKYSSTP